MSDVAWRVLARPQRGPLFQLKSAESEVTAVLCVCESMVQDGDVRGRDGSHRDHAHLV